MQSPENTLNRCQWAGEDPLYVDYHDHEWGRPVHDDRKLFEFLLLEGAQAGLSWITILRKRENYRQAFDHFDYEKIARYDESKLRSLLSNAGLVRNRLKINSAITNAQAYLKIKAEFSSFDRYLWRFVAGKPVVNHWRTLAEVPASTPLSDALAKDLKQRGFKFVGSTICYAYMQSMGLVDDHLTSCFVRSTVC